MLLYLNIIRFFVVLIMSVAASCYVDAAITCPTTKDIHAGHVKCIIDRNLQSAAQDGTDKQQLKLSSTSKLSDIIRIAVERHPQVLAARARVQEALAGIDVAKANGLPQLEGSYGLGYGTTSETLTPLTKDILSDAYLTPQLRNELTLSGKQLIYDFGSTGSGVLRAVSLKSSQDYSLQEKIDEIAFNVADSFMKIVQGRELSRLNKDNIEALQKIQSLVIANQANGNGTMADVKRVEARLVDAKTVAADNEADLQNSIDHYRRLVKQEPGQLSKTPDVAAFVPKSPSLAVEMLPHSSVHLLSIDLAIRAAEYELKSKKQGILPQVVLTTDAVAKAYSGQKYKNDLDVRAMLTLSYKFIDGGLADAQIAQILARLSQEQQRYDFDHDEAEADLRQLYNSIDAARGKSKALAEGVDASAKARELYTEQFRGGKRTLFELLDIQTAYFTASRNQILNYFEEQRSNYAVLKTLGLFTQTVMNVKSEPQGDNLVTNSIGDHSPFPEPLVDWTLPTKMHDRVR